MRLGAGSRRLPVAQDCRAPYAAAAVAVTGAAIRAGRSPPTRRPVARSRSVMSPGAHAESLSGAARIAVMELFPRARPYAKSISYVKRLHLVDDMVASQGGCAR